jgi:hypothetical protein
MGLMMALVGPIWIMAPSIPWFGRLPGDIRFEGKSFRYFPLATCVLLSLVLTAILWALCMLRG